jgi:hypothetical protein
MALAMAASPSTYRKSQALRKGMGRIDLRFSGSLGVLVVVNTPLRERGMRIRRDPRTCALIPFIRENVIEAVE